MVFGNVDYHYVVTVEYRYVTKRHFQRLSFHTEYAAYCEAKAIAEHLADAEATFEIEVRYVDLEHDRLLKGYCNVPADEE